MTISPHRITVNCDNFGCNDWQEVGIGETDTGVRDRIARHGWKSFTGRKDVQDFCPVHAPEVSDR